MSLLRRVLASPPPQPLPLADWLTATEADLEQERPIARAVLGGATAPNVGAAFALSYRAALVHLTGRRAAALCVTEARGNHPRTLETTATGLDPIHIRGTKQWATLANRAEELLVAAVEGERAGRPQIGVFAVPARLATLEAMPPTPFVPEVPHFRIHLDVELPASARLSGDGWADVVKPFRTVEDTFVTAALCALAARRDPARWTGWLAGLVALAEEDPDDPGVHLALDGLMRAVHAALGELSTEDEALARDLGLLRIAGKARALRVERARQRLGL